MSCLFIFIIIIIINIYYRSLVTQTDPYLAKPYVDILLPEFTHQETLLFSQFLYSGELRYKEGGGGLKNFFRGKVSVDLPRELNFSVDLTYYIYFRLKQRQLGRMKALLKLFRELQI